MKTVFNSSEIAHIWANASAPYGKCPGNISFDHDTISSYATVIGRRIKDRGKSAYVLDRASFSKSTTKHQSRVQSAIPSAEKVFHVRCGERGQRLDFNGKTLAAHYEARAVAKAGEMPSRYSRIRAEQYQEITRLYTEAREALAFFGYGTARLDLILAKRQAGDATAAETLKLQGEKMAAAKAASLKRQEKERTENAIGHAQEFLAGQHREHPLDLQFRSEVIGLIPEPLRSEFVAAVKENNARLEAETVGNWRAGKNVRLPNGTPTMLRVDGDDMETSHGARVPMADAERTFKFVLACREKGWHRNGTTHAVGPYQLEAVNNNGVVAGCHHVSWAEIETFAAAAGWVGGGK